MGCPTTGVRAIGFTAALVALVGACTDARSHDVVDSYDPGHVGLAGDVMVTGIVSRAAVL